VKKLLLDECIPRKFKSHLSGYDCLTAPEAGWAGKTNGELLSLAENAGFQVFVSLDQCFGASPCVHAVRVRGNMS
jgi:hypothetical protein